MVLKQVLVSQKFMFSFRQSMKIKLWSFNEENENKFMA